MDLRIELGRRIQGVGWVESSRLTYKEKTWWVSMTRPTLHFTHRMSFLLSLSDRRYLVVCSSVNVIETISERAMMRGRRFGIVADGFWRARTASAPIIQAEVESEFAARLKTATLVERIMLEAEMRREMARRLEKAAPRGALY